MHVELRMVLRGAITASSSATPGQTASNLPDARSGAVTCTRSAPRKVLPHKHYATADLRKENPPPHPANYRGCRYAKEMQKKKSQKTPWTTTGRVFSSNFTTPGMSFAAALQGSTEEQQQPQTHQVELAGPATILPRIPAALLQHEQQTTGQSVRAPNVNSLPLDKTLKVVVL
jgi:hypothetical protein